MRDGIVGNQEEEWYDQVKLAKNQAAKSGSWVYGRLCGGCYL